MAVFQVFVLNSASQPLVGLAIRLLAPDNTDITATRFGTSPVYTDASGLFTKFYLGTSGLTAGVYHIQLSAPGYVDQVVATAGTFTGTGNFTVTLVTNPTSATVDLVEPESGYVSPMAPVEFTVPGVSTSSGWEFIEATVTDGLGYESVIEVPVVGGDALINLQARLELEPVLCLVGDSIPAVIDATFAKQFSVTLASLTASGRLTLTNTFSIRSANAFPTGDENDLTNFTNAAESGLADWLTPWADSELPKFAGHYADASIWLPIPGPGDYTLQVVYQDINRANLSTQTIDLDSTLFASGQAVRIRIPEPITSAQYATLTIWLDDEAQTHSLTVRYHG